MTQIIRAYTNRPLSGNLRWKDLHLPRFTALSAAPDPNFSNFYDR